MKRYETSKAESEQRAQETKKPIDLDHNRVVPEFKSGLEQEAWRRHELAKSAGGADAVPGFSNASVQSSWRRQELAKLNTMADGDVYQKAKPDHSSPQRETAGYLRDWETTTAAQEAKNQEIQSRQKEYELNKQIDAVPTFTSNKEAQTYVNKAAAELLQSNNPANSDHAIENKNEKRPDHVVSKNPSGKNQ